MTYDPARPKGEDAALRQRAREIAQAGTLPNRRPDRVWGGNGRGAECVICATPVNQDEAEWEIEFARNGDGPAHDVYHLHARCFMAWESERENSSSPTVIISRGRPARKRRLDRSDPVTP